MDDRLFDTKAYEMWEAVPPSFKERIRNVALLIDDEPSEEVRLREGLTESDTLLGLYEGIPNTERGEGYGVGAVVPDTITLFRKPIYQAAHEDMTDAGIEITEENYEREVERVLRETLWHEVGHYFGLSDDEIHKREEEGTNMFRA